ncbi:MAG: EF-hand domain-containing protein [Pseudomonadota bacterium]
MTRTISACFAALALTAAPAVHADTYEEQLLQLKAKFKDADKNSDGKLSKQEAKDGGMNRLAMGFSRVDTDKDGYVTLAQLEERLQARQK